MGLARFGIQRPVTAVMIMVALVLLGVVALLLTPVELEPNLSLPIAAVSTSWPGASPTQVELQVTDPLEQALESLPGVAYTTSTSSEGQSTIILEFDFGTDVQNEVTQMQSIVERVQAGLPSGVHTPVVEQFNPNAQPVLTVVVSGASLPTLSALVDNVVEPAVEEAQGVGSVTPVGNLTQEVLVQLDPTRLAQYHLSVNQVLTAIQESNVIGAVGQLNRATQQVPLQVSGQIQNTSDILSIPIPDGPQGLTVGDVATARMGDAPQTQIVEADGKPAVAMTVVQSASANTVQVAQAVEAALRQLVVTHQLPPGIHLQIVNNEAATILGTLDTVVTHTILGFLIGVAIVLLILRNWRATGIIVVVIPISVFTTFLLLYLASQTVNAVTLGALAVGLGSLVDFAVVVLESIFRARQRLEDPRQAALAGTQEVSLAVLASAIAQICVFAPMIFVPGIAGQFLTPIGLTVTFVHMAAWFVAVLLVPMLASRMLRGRGYQALLAVPGVDVPFRAWSLFDWSGAAMAAIVRTYRRLLAWSLRHGWAVIAGTVLLLLATLAIVPGIGFELAPAVANGELTIAASLPPGTSLGAATAIGNELTLVARQHLPGVRALYTQIGTASGPRAAGASSVTVTAFLPSSDTTNTLTRLAFGLRPFVSNIPGVQVAVVPGNAVFGLTSGVSVTIEGPDPATLDLLADEVAGLMSRIPGIGYVQNGVVSGLPTYQLTLNPALLSAYGVSPATVLNTLGTAIQGSQAGTFYQGTLTYPIVVSLPTAYGENPANLQTLTVPSATGNLVPVLDLGSLSLISQPPSITEQNRVPDVTVSAEVQGISAGQAQALIAQAISRMRIPAGYQVVAGSGPRFLSLGSTFEDLGLALAFAVVLVYMVMASLFESLLTPFVILFALPGTLVGAAWGLYLTHRTLNVESLIGLIMLVGLVTNNAIVLVDYTNQLRARGLPLRQALVEAGAVRLRPILMTTLTTVLAMLPLVVGGGTGSETLTSMATLVSSGLFVSMLVSLVLVPVMYVLIDRRDRRVAPPLAPSLPEAPPAQG